MNGSNKDCLIYKYLLYAVVDFSEHGQSIQCWTPSKIHWFFSFYIEFFKSLLGKVLCLRILGIHIRSVNPPLHSRQPWDLTPHSHHQRESRIHIRSRNPSSIHVSHGNLVDSLHQWEFSFNSQVGCESMSNSH